MKYKKINIEIPKSLITSLYDINDHLNDRTYLELFIRRDRLILKIFDNFLSKVIYDLRSR